MKVKGKCTIAAADRALITRRKRRKTKRAFDFLMVFFIESAAFISHDNFFLGDAAPQSAIYCGYIKLTW